LTSKKYQNAQKQRSQALEKIIMDKANTKALDDPHSSVAYDLWNKKDAKKEKAKEIVGKNLAGFIDQVTKKL